MAADTADNAGKVVRFPAQPAPGETHQSPFQVRTRTLKVPVVFVEGPTKPFPSFPTRRRPANRASCITGR
jgi:hypothetical protein